MPKMSATLPLIIEWRGTNAQELKDTDPSARRGSSVGYHFVGVCPVPAGVPYVQVGEEAVVVLFFG